MTLEIRALDVRYGSRAALAVTTVRLEPGELVALVGPNGAGKSSLLKALAGVVPSGGRVAWRGCDLAPLAPLERGRTIAYLPQNPVAHWPMLVRDLVALGRLPHRRLGEDESEADRKAITTALRAVGVDAFAERSVATLSGGERARALLARALAVDAPVLLADEPIASLDPYHQLQVMSQLRACATPDTGRLVIAALHDLTLAARFCTRVLLLHAGLVVGDGPPREVLSPAALQRYYRVAAYVGSYEEQDLIVPWRMLD